MALPDELLDELLTGHLDDALSGDERARVEQMLRDDPSLRQRLQRLREQISETKQAAWPPPELSDGFADQVVQAAIDHARDQGLPDEHPLRRAESGTLHVEPAATPRFHGGTERRTGWVIAATLGLAASIVFAAFVLQDRAQRQEPNSRPGTLLADQDPTSVSERDAAGPMIDASGDRVADAGSAASTTEAGAQPLPDAESGLASVDRTPSGAAMEPGRADEPAATLDRPAMEAVAESSVTNVPQDRAADDDAPKNAASAAQIQPLQSLLVIRVQLTDVGRAADPLEDALASAAIETGAEQPIGDALAGVIPSDDAAQNATESEGERVVLLQAPAKKLDRLIQQLIADGNGVASVQFSLISEAPLLRSVDAVRSEAIDPTEIRHAGKSWPIVGGSNPAFDVWSNRLGSRAFIPMDAQTGSKAVRMAAGSDDGPDVMEHLLILIR
ncbi:hypothetical protein FYK55_00725 [Roseiconus nitratireducens]|uniref:Uncharacterized protein n=1 Tax=Roseiconus nitratireducens TaxID=2605748 RepID=A0A5M6DHF9_9BACT|nr:hypothetical protein [Roseiconus nitratireducens]KAA5546977.1 hypothetical protein FYK55_00725 [Roseiconus nitratireducens]